MRLRRREEKAETAADPLPSQGLYLKGQAQSPHHHHCSPRDSQVRVQSHLPLWPWEHVRNWGTNWAAKHQSTLLTAVSAGAARGWKRATMGAPCLWDSGTGGGRSEQCTYQLVQGPGFAALLTRSCGTLECCATMVENH